MPARSYDPVNLTMHWENLLKILEERNATLAKNSHGFSYNPFVPRMVIGYAPNISAFNNVMQYFSYYFRLMKIEGYKSCDDLRKDSVAKSLFCGICFGTNIQDSKEIEQDRFVNSLYPYHFKLQLMFPDYLRYYNDTFLGSGWPPTHSLYSVEYSHLPRSFVLNDGGYVGYVREGFSHIQNTISSSYLKVVIDAQNSSFKIPQLVLNRFPQGKHRRDNTLENVNYGISFMLVMCNIYPILITVSNIVAEKEIKIKALTKVFGYFMHFLSWVVKSTARSLISTVATIISLKIKWYLGVAIFNNITFAPLLVVIFVYNLTGICFFLMLSSFFKHTFKSVINIVYIWFLTYIPFMMSLTEYQYGKTTLGLMFMFIFHNTTFGYLIQSIVIYEQCGNKFATLDIFTAQDLQTDLSISTYVPRLLIQSLVYMIISLYIDEVFPGHYDVTQRWKFPFMLRKNYLGTASKSIPGYTQPILKPESLVYEIAPTGPVVVDINKVTKKYGNDEVIKNISLQLRQNEITVLVGHNASGKTTLASMICGLISPTKGSISIDGFTVDKDQKFACASLGICTQNTILYVNLTVKNQLCFFGYLKGLNGMSVKDEVEKYLQAANLLSLQDVLTKDLHLSPKQELAICCALIGRTRIVVLDEPNADLDEVARIRNWELITKERHGRTILITASSPDVLEVLGDRVAILAHGQLQCVGSPAFVKQIYGKGYRLICTKGPNCDSESLTTFIRDYVPSIILASEISNKIVYILNEQYSEILEELSKQLQGNGDSLDLNNYSLRSMNLSDVYLRMGSFLLDILNGRTIYPEEDNNLKFIDIKHRIIGCKFLLQQMNATIKYHFKILRYYKAYLIKKLLLPPLLTFLSFQVSFFSKIVTELPSMNYCLKQYARSTIIFETKANLSINAKKIAEEFGQNVFWKGVTYSIDTIQGISIEDHLFKKYDVWNIKSVYHVGATFFEDRIVCWFRNQGLHTVPLTLNLAHNAIIRSLFGDDSSIQIPTAIDFVHIDAQMRSSTSTGNLLGIFITIAAAFVLCGRNYFITKDYKTRINNITVCAGSHIGIMSMTSAFAELIFILLMAIGVTFIMMLYQKQVSYPFSIYVWWFLVIVASAFCMYSFNTVIAEFFHDPVHAFIIAISLAFFSIVIYSHYAHDTADRYISATKLPGSTYFLWLPHFAMCNAISIIYYHAEFKRACESSGIRLTSVALEKCELPPNCCSNYDILDANTGVLYELIAFTIITSLSWLLILLKQTKRFWTCRLYPRDTYFAQLYEHRFRHNNEESRFSQRQAFMESYKIKRMRRGDLPEYGLISNCLGRYYRDKIGIDRINLTIPRLDILNKNYENEQRLRYL